MANRTYRDLIAQGRTDAVLSDATGGRLEQAGRFRELLQGYGCTDELRAVLRANDHRKAIYARIGVGSRSELAARLQADQYDPRTHAGRAPRPYGGFLGQRTVEPA